MNDIPATPAQTADALAAASLQALLFRVVQTVIKASLVWASLRLPQVFPNTEIDPLVAQFAPVVVTAICALWTVAQHYLEALFREALAASKASAHASSAIQTGKSPS